VSPTQWAVEETRSDATGILAVRPSDRPPPYLVSSPSPPGWGAGSVGQIPDLDRALKSAGQARITKAVKTRSPRLAVKVVEAVTGALDAQSVIVPAPN
jgi:hypothetical protein